MSNNQHSDEPATNVVSLSERLRQAAKPKVSDNDAYNNAVLDQLTAKEHAIIMSLGW